MSVSKLHTYSGTNLGNSVAVNLSPSPGQGDTELAIVYGYNTANTCYALNIPSGWSQYDSTCTGSRNEMWTLTHTAGTADTQYTFSVNTTKTNEYFSVVVYDLSGVNGTAPIDGHADQAFVSGTSQSTASLTPKQSGDLAIATFGTAYVKDPTVQSPYTFDLNVDSGVYLTAGHDALSGTGATSASANYSSAPASGESNLILVAAANTVPAIVQEQPLLRVVSEGAIPSGTGLLYYGQVARETADCPGRSFGSPGCQSYPNYSIEQDYCDYDGSSSTLAVHANNTPVEADFLHTAAPITSTNRESFSSVDGKCTWKSGTYFLMNLASSDSASWLSTNVLNSGSIPSNGVFFDGNGLWYTGTGLGMVEFGASGSSCSPYPTCNHQYVSGGLDNTSYDAAIGYTINKAQSGFHILLNNLSPAQTTGACYALTTMAPYHCVGGHYNFGTYDSRVKLDELCSAITANTDLDMIRAENSQNAGPQNPPTVNPALGEENAVILNTAYDLQYNQTSNGCKYTGILLQENYPWVSASTRWEEDDITAMQWMAPSSDGTPDRMSQQPYSYCFDHSCSTDYDLYPDALVVPYGPTFTTTAYNHGTYASPHDATDCAATGSPASVQGDSGGATSMVAYCQAASYPVFAAGYNHCYFVQYDLGSCIAIFNTGTSSVSLSLITKLNLSGYHYQLKYAGNEWGKYSGASVGSMFPWLSTSSTLYNALSAEYTACSSSTYCNGTVSFVTPPASVAANSAIFLVANKPSNY